MTVYVWCRVSRTSGVCNEGDAYMCLDAIYTILHPVDQGSIKFVKTIESTTELVILADKGTRGTDLEVR